jgi:hypothetical protein
LGLPNAQEFVKAADMIKKPIFAVIGRPNFPATIAAMKAARVAVGQTPLALGAIGRALTELQTTGGMTEAQKGALSRAKVEKVERVEELNALSRKYNLPSGSGSER